ncbi:alpha/beta hydrolase family protein [Streptomyces sp. cg36]|uniref:alpha/beta hydrolase family protein n=1 Tax=Streptomyces sp. cg36 TaxID=3238798 RepID=UPI0034E21002
MITVTRAATAVTLSLALALPLAAASGASAAPGATASSGQPAAPAPSPAPVAAPMTLPRPTGEYGVGSSVFHLVDHSRKDPWNPAAKSRELMLTLHYPAARSGGPGPVAPYATTAETALLVKGMGMEKAVPAEVLSATRTNSRPDARPAGGSHPLIVLSPGFGGSRYTMTALAEDLASRGYVVASVDHAYESYGISVPGGRTLTCLACTAVGEGGVSGSVVTATRAGDVSFVLDRLTGRHSFWRYASMIDQRRIGMAGHSIGGASAASTMAGDSRVRAGVNMDGAFWDELPRGLGGRPFMMLGTGDHRPGGPDGTWDRTWPRLDGWKRWITVAGSEHYTFTDAPLTQAHFGLPQPPLPEARALDITRTYVAAFFDQHLRGIARPVLDGPTAGNPEVTFEDPKA